MSVDGDGGPPPAGSIMGSMIEFARIAADGGFEVDQKGGERILKAIEEFQHWLDVVSNRAWQLEQERQLGSSNAAKALSPFLLQIVSDKQGFITQMRALRDSLNQARDGIKIAMENYRKTEESIRSTLSHGEA